MLRRSAVNGGWRNRNRYLGFLSGFLLLFSFVSTELSRAEDAQLDRARSALTRTDYDEAFRLTLPLAENGDAQAQAFLGSLYAHGRGTRQDDLEAVRWFRAAAESGDAGGQYALGSMYLSGRGGLTYSPEKAAFWIQKAADQDLDLAQYMLSRMYADGLGVAKDPAKAAMWKDRAGKKMEALGKLFSGKKKGD